MNMNKALQHLYKAISGNDTSKVNISKLLLDIHYAATGVECAVKNNWARIIDSLATNWTGGGGSSDFSGAEVTIVTAINEEIEISVIYVMGEDFGIPYEHYTGYYYMEASMSPATITVPLYKGKASCLVMGNYTISVSGDASISEMKVVTITGDCTITIS